MHREPARWYTICAQCGSRTPAKSEGHAKGMAVAHNKDRHKNRNIAFAEKSS